MFPDMPVKVLSLAVMIMRNDTDTHSVFLWLCYIPGGNIYH